MKLSRVLIAACLATSLASVSAIPTSATEPAPTAPTAPTSTATTAVPETASSSRQIIDTAPVVDLVPGLRVSAATEYKLANAWAAPIAVQGNATVGNQAVGSWNTPARIVTSKATVGQVTVFYVGSVPDQVRTTMEAAINEWSTAVELNPNAPIEISVEWTGLGFGVLGVAGSPGIVRDPPVWGLQGYLPLALANTLDGTDVATDREEIRIQFNSDFGDWHLDHTTPPPSNKYDLYTVALHEIGHGMGFAGSAGFGALDSSTMEYDLQVFYGDVPLLDAVATGDESAILQSDNLFFDLGGLRKYKLYAPNPFQTGSSFSHFDEDAYPAGTPGALMSPTVFNGEEYERLDAPVLGVLQEIGWPMRVKPAQPIIEFANPATFGQINVQWGEDLNQRAIPPIGYHLGAYRSGSLDSQGIVPFDVTNVVMPDIKPGADYELVVTPIGSDGRYGTSAKVQLRSATDPSDPNAPTPPGTPTLVSQDGGRNAKVTWTAATDDVGVAQYRVYNAAGDVQIAAVTTAQADLSLDIGTHQVYVRAVDAAGNESGQSGQLSITITQDPIQQLASDPSFTALHGEVLRLYWAFFSRDPDASGAVYWMGISDQGYDLDVIAENFAASEEFFNTYGASTSNAEFLQIVYYNVLGRSSDISGYEYWLDQMDNNGLSQGGVVRWVAANDEFRVQHPYGIN